MTNYTKIYWLTRLDNIQGALIAVLMVSIIAFVIYTIVKYVECVGDTEELKEYAKKHGKIAKMATWGICISAPLLLFMPTRNDLIIIYAGGKTLDFAQSDTSLSKIPYQTTAIITEYLDQQLKEPEKK